MGLHLHLLILMDHILFSLPEGSYSAYSEIPMDENSIEVSLKRELIGEENIPSKAGQDAMLIMAKCTWAMIYHFQEL